MANDPVLNAAPLPGGLDSGHHPGQYHRDLAANRPRGRLEDILAQFRHPVVAACGVISAVPSSLGMSRRTAFARQRRTLVQENPDLDLREHISTHRLDNNRPATSAGMSLPW